MEEGKLTIDLVNMGTWFQVALLMLTEHKLPNLEVTIPYHGTFYRLHHLITGAHTPQAGHLETKQ